MVWLCQSSEHDTDHGETEPGDGGGGVALEVAREPSVAADPGEGPFDDPALGQNHEAAGVVALDDLERPSPGLGEGGGELWPLVGGVGEDALDEGEQPAGAAQQLDRAVAILDVGRVDAHVEQKPERVDQDVALAPRDLLARVVALRVERSPPLGAALALWLSMIAALGLASRPACARLSR